MCCHLAVRHTGLHQHAVRERQRFLPLSRRLSRRILSDSIKTEAVMLFRGGSTLAKKFFAGFHCGGHRGSPRVAPENTIESFEKAKQSNVDLIEFDLSLTKDAVAIIMHDDDLERTCAEKTPVSALLAHEIVTKNAAKNFKFADGKQKICPVPTLEETVKYVRDSNLKMLFDVKDGSKEMISQIVNVISKNNLYDQVIVSSFFAWVPYAVKKADPKILTGVTWRPYFFSYSDIENKHPRFTGLKHYLAVLLDWINVKMIHSFLPQFVGAEMVLTQERDINGCFVDDMQKKNIQVVAWTVNDQRQMMHFVDTLKVGGDFLFQCCPHQVNYEVMMKVCIIYALSELGWNIQ
ncbi:unnamed protein product [Anisakis simplex]|uniref:Glycerophosphodiester phosphodiesterase 1 (inferred by orthology to a human protein) n=1 Tax=Anisakis simplex TaxID=6269 RepID=A0A0M3K9C6_ANISI|nr:unnamed protein product [Anisakis simplex]